MKYQELSLLTIGIIQLALLGLSALALCYGITILAVILFFGAAFGFIAKRWTILAAKKASVRVSAAKTRLFPKDRTDILFSLKNEKALSVPWLDVRGPAELSEKFGRVGGFNSITFKKEWIAEKRGILSLRSLEFVTGDPFGMSEAGIAKEPSSVREIVIYPRVTPVNVDYFTANMWEGEQNPHGILDDVSLIKNTKPYDSSDSPKSINWRLMARGKELTVNRYERISPTRYHFVFDGESFTTYTLNNTNGNSSIAEIKKNVRREELEDALSILCSIMLRLSEQSIQCGFSFPSDDRLQAVNIPPLKENMSEILYRMAEYEPKTLKQISGASFTEADNGSEFAGGKLGLSDASDRADRMYFVTLDEKHAQDSPFFDSKNGKMILLTLGMLKKMRGGEKNE